MKNSTSPNGCRRKQIFADVQITAETKVFCIFCLIYFQASFFFFLSELFVIGIFGRADFSPYNVRLVIRKLFLFQTIRRTDTRGLAGYTITMVRRAIFGTPVISGKACKRLFARVTGTFNKHECRLYKWEL